MKAVSHIGRIVDVKIDLKRAGPHDGEDVLLVKRPDHVDPRVEVDFDIYNPPNVRDGFHAAWKALQDSGVSNIVWTPRNGGHWIATSGHAIKEIFADNRYFSTRINFVPKAAAEFSKLMPSNDGSAGASAGAKPAQRQSFAQSDRAIRGMDT